MNNDNVLQPTTYKVKLLCPKIEIGIRGYGLSEENFTSDLKLKLDEIEEGAEVNQSDSDIKTQYENNANTNAFTDSEKSKLNTIEEGAEVNVNADWNAVSGKAELLNRPTKLSDFTNDGFATENWVNEQDFLTEETDPIFTASPAAGISNTDITNWDEKGVQLTADQPSANIHLKDSAGNIISTLNVGFLNNEGTTISFNTTTDEIELKNDEGVLLSSFPASALMTGVGYGLNLTGSTLELTDSANNVIDSVILTITNIQGLQAAFDGKANHGYGEGEEPKTLKEVDDALGNLYDPYLSLVITPTQVSNAPLEETYIDEIGDYFEVRCSNPQDGRGPVNNNPHSFNISMIRGFRSNGGFYGNDNFYFRSDSTLGADYRIWESPVGFDKSKVHTYRLEIVSDGAGGKLWELFVDEVSWGTKPYSQLANINSIGATSVGTLQGTIEFRYSYVTVNKSGSTTTYQAEDLIEEAVNGKLIPIETIESLHQRFESLEFSAGNPQCFVSYEKEDNKFVIYTRDKTRENIYYGFDLELQSSIGEDAHEIVYSHLWRVRYGYIYNYSNGEMVQGTQILLSVENEFTYLVDGKDDHTGGFHGDERIDIDPNSGVTFYINGVPLTAGDLAESFDLIPCNTFHYLQKSTLHETAVYETDTDTGIPATGSGVVTIDSNQNIVIDGVNTGLGAYHQQIVYNPGEITLTTSPENTWVIEPRLYIPVSGHPVVANHIKKTTFENQGYRTWNRTTFTETQDIKQLFVGILCVHKNTAKYVNNEDYTPVEMTGSQGSFLTSNENRLYEGYNDTTNLSSKVESWLLKSTNGYLDKDCQMFVVDRATDSKYYRKVMNTIVNPDDIIEGELVVSWNSK